MLLSTTCFAFRFQRIRVLSQPTDDWGQAGDTGDNSLIPGGQVESSHIVQQQLEKEGASMETVGSRTTLNEV